MLRKENKILTSKEYNFLRNKRFINTPYFRVNYFFDDYYPSGKPKNNPAKFGFIISTKYGNAVARNLLKRRLRAILHNYINIRNLQLIIIANPKAKELKYVELEKMIVAILKHLLK
jgi:ribonuclease P protein component